MNVIIETKELKWSEEVEVKEIRITDKEIKIEYKDGYEIKIDIGEEYETKIEQKKKHISLAIQYASQALIPIDKVFSSIATVEGYILRDLKKKKIVMDVINHLLKEDDTVLKAKLPVIVDYFIQVENGNLTFNPKLKCTSIFSCIK